MEPGGGGGAGPLPANNKARGGAAPPGKGRDLGRPPRKDSEVSAAAAAGPGCAGGGRRPSREGRGPAGAAPGAPGPVPSRLPPGLGPAARLWCRARPRQPLSGCSGLAAPRCRHPAGARCGPGPGER